MLHVNKKTWGIHFKALAFMTGIMMILSPVTLLFADQPAEATLTEQGYVRTVSATGSINEAQPQTPALPNPNDPVVSPLSNTTNLPANDPLTDEERIRVLSQELYTANLLSYEETQIAGQVLRAAVSDGTLYFESAATDGTKHLVLAYRESASDSPITHFIKAFVAHVNKKQNEAESRTADKLVTAFHGLMNQYQLTAYVPFRPGPITRVSETTAWVVRSLFDKANEKIEQVKENFKDQDLDRSMAMTAALNAFTDSADQRSVSATTTKDDDYQVVDSINLDGELAAIHYLKNLPQGLQPFYRLFLKSQYVNPERAKRYEGARQKVLKIYRMAKAGKGLIRYKDRVCPAYLPFMDERGGSYELVIPR